MNVSKLLTPILAVLTVGIVVWYGVATGVHSDIPWLSGTALSGWVTYPLRTLGEARFDWEGIATFLITLAAITLMGHCFLRWFFGSSESGSPETQAWPWRRSLLLSASVVVLFVLCVAVSSIYHHVAFLATSGRPVRVEKFKPYDPERAMGALSSMTFFVPGDPSWQGDARHWLANRERVIGAYMEKVQTGFITTPSGGIYAAVTLPRDPADLARLGFVVKNDYSPEGETIHPASEWPAILDTLRAEAAAFVTPQATPQVPTEPQQ